MIYSISRRLGAISDSLAGRVVRDIDAVIGFYYSTSFASRPLFGDSIDDFENELRSELLRVSPSGEFSAISRSTEVIYGVRLRPRL